MPTTLRSSHNGRSRLATVGSTGALLRRFTAGGYRLVCGLALVVSITVACGPAAEHVPRDALTERDQHRSVTTGEKFWVMDGGRSGGTNVSWHLQPQEHMTVVSTDFFNTDPCGAGESGCPFGYTGFLISFDAAGDYDVHIIQCEWNVSCAPAEAFDIYTYHVGVT